MAHAPEYSDSDDSLFDDDGDYVDFKARIKNLKIQSNEPTEAEKKQQELKAFFTAISTGNKESVLEFFERGIDVNVRLDEKWTPLLISASCGNLELTSIMIQKGADVNSDRDGVTALMMACNCPEYTSDFATSFEVVKLLIEKGANVNVVDRKRMNALMYAANIGNFDAVKYLLPLSVKNAEDNQKWTALFWAVMGNNPEIVQYLIEQKFDINAEDVRGNTPLDIAKDNEYEKVIQLFPEDKYDIVLNLIDQSQCEFEENFQNNGTPNFYSDVYNFLCAIKCEHLIKLFNEKNIKLANFLQLSDSELKDLGVQFPYQRNRILGGLYRFHKQMYHPKSIHHVNIHESYSNVDVAVQILTAIKQTIAMEASLKFIRKGFKDEAFSQKELKIVKENVQNIRKRVKLCRMVAKQLKEKVYEWDKVTEPVDLITKYSVVNNVPWRKIIFGASVISVVIVFRICK